MKVRQSVILLFGTLGVFWALSVVADGQVRADGKDLCRVWKEPKSFVGQTLMLRVRHRLIWGQLFVFADGCPKQMIAIQYLNPEERNAVIQETGQYLENHRPGWIEGPEMEILAELRPSRVMRKPKGVLKNYVLSLRTGTAKPFESCAVLKEPVRFDGNRKIISGSLFKEFDDPMEKVVLTGTACRSVVMPVAFPIGKRGDSLKKILENSLFCVDGAFPDGCLRQSVVTKGRIQRIPGTSNYRFLLEDFP